MPANFFYGIISWVINMIKLVVTDLDGTLVCNHKVSAENLKTIKALQDRNYLFTVATGRHIDSARRVTDHIDLKLPMICNNGAQIIDTKTFDILYEVPVDEHHVRDIVSYCDENDIQYLLCSSRHILCSLEAQQLLLKHVGKVPVIIQENSELKLAISKGIIKVLVVDFNQKKLDSVTKFLEDRNDLAVVMSQTGFLNISHKDATKGTALNHLAEMLDVSLSETLALGDEENDTTMIMNAGIGVAMGNGTKKLKELADDITLSNCKDGFTHTIKKHILNT